MNERDQPKALRATSLVLAAILGGLIWVLASFLIHHREPWDSSLYWTLIYPLTTLAAVVLAYINPFRPKLQAVILFEAQLVGMWIRNGEIGNLWPMGMMMMAIVALPAAFLASIVASRVQKSP